MGGQCGSARARAVFPAEHRAENNGEFQALALVHGHQPHYIVIFAEDVGTVAVAFLAQLFQMGEKAGEGAGNALVEG